MSIALMSMAWWLDLSPMQQSVLLVLCDHADDFGENCFPSVGLISWKLGRSRRHIQRTLRELESIGIIAVDELGGGRQNTTRYRITLENGVRKTPFSSKHSATTCPETVTPASQTVTPASRNGDTGVTRTIIEPSLSISNHHSSSAERSSSLCDAAIVLRELNRRARLRFMPTRDNLGTIELCIVANGRDVVLQVMIRAILESWPSSALRPSWIFIQEHFEQTLRRIEKKKPITREDGTPLEHAFEPDHLEQINAPWPDVKFDERLLYDIEGAACRAFFS